jgi:hypothetical protein
MVVELRKIGSRWALYTDDMTVFRRLSKYVARSKKIKYMQNGKLVGIDFYFDRKSARFIHRIARGQLPLDL